MFGLDLQEEICFYKKYHSNSVNVMIHITCVPMILFSYVVLCSYLELPSEWLTPVLGESSAIKKLQPYLNLGLLVSIVYSIFYIMLDWFGFLAAPILLGFSVGSKWLVMNKFEQDTYQVMWFLVVVNVFSWIAQFIGHGVYEGKKPALLDSLVQALLLAPYFVLFEIAFALGFRKDLEKDLNNKTARILSQERKQQQKSE
ncbi:Mpo1 protein [Saccharomycopsis crataegensis]|uniref:Mpo1 protein n=1 Tax=Saccharomycopsis crataegensis TaxID=43959 RepID=A0AAV5QUG7_9ASCO|nr:Mpo1 protein [Saccharomycopsis crataegensis]